jgi:hypothetical protein
MALGALLVQGYPTGVATYVSAAEGGPLREALDAAIGVSGVAMGVPPRFDRGSELTGCPAVLLRRSRTAGRSLMCVFD